MICTIRSVRRLTCIIGGTLLVASVGCAHRREAYYPGDLASPSPGVRVRAPFVDVQVRGKPKQDREERAARRDDDRDDDDRD